MTSTETSVVGFERPYVGLTYFTEEKAALFFGRDAERAVIIGNLRAARLTLLYAQSGVGKSSLLRAGVAAQLREQARRDMAARGAPRFVPVVCSSWSEEPVARLIDAIEESVQPFVDGALALPRDSVEEALELVTKELGATLLLILDQFEEYLLYRPTRDSEGVLADQVARCVNRPDLAANFLISVRDDAYSGVLDLFRGRVANAASNVLLLEHLHRSGARDAILRPLELYNERHPGEQVTIEPELVDAVLSQVRVGQVEADEDGHDDVQRPATSEDLIDTTYLQLVMERLWNEEAARGSRVLRLETFETLGGASAIIASHLDLAMAELSAEERDAAASVFSFLVTKGGTKIALTPKDLAELANVGEDRLDPVLRRLAAGDVHILRPVALRRSENGASYEISHDALARPIVAWRTRYREERQEAEREELAAKVREAERRAARERMRKRAAIAALGVVVVALIGTAVVFAWVRSRNADRLQKITYSNDIAGKIPDLSGRPTFGPGAAALAAVEAYRLYRTSSARNQLLRVLQENPALPTVLSGHQRAVLAVAVSRRGLVASASNDATVRLWAMNGHQIGVLRRRDLSTYANLAFSPSGDLLAATLERGQLELWDVSDPKRPTAKLRRPLRLEKNESCDYFPCEPVAFSPDGKQLAWGGETAGVWLWDIRDPSRPKRLRHLRIRAKVSALAFDSGGKTLAIADRDGVRVASVSGGRKIQMRTRATGESYAVAWSEDGKLAAGVGKSVRVWNHKGSSLYRLRSEDYVNGVGFLSPHVLVSGAADGLVTTWDLRHGRAFGPPRAHTDAVNAVATSADGKMIASGGDDYVVKLWRSDGRGALARTVFGVPGLENLSVGAENHVAATSSYGPPIYVLSLGAGGSSPRATKLADHDYSLAYHENVLVGEALSGGSFTLWDTGKSSCPSMPQRACTLVTQKVKPTLQVVAFNPSGKLVATGDDQGRLTVWKHTSRRRLRPLGSAKQPSNINVIAFDPVNPDVVATAATDGTVRFWSLSALRHGRRHAEIGKPGRWHEGFEVFEVAFSPDGKLLASGGDDQQVRLWDVSNLAHPRAVGLPLFQSSTISAVSFSPNGKTLAVTDRDDDTCMYDVETLRLVGSSYCLNTGTGATFARSGGLLSGGPNRPIVSWSPLLWSRDEDDGTESALAAAACRMAGRNLTAAEWHEAFAGTPLEQHRHKTCDNFPLP